MNFLKPALFSLAVFTAAQMPFALAADNWVKPLGTQNLLAQATPDSGSGFGQHGKRHGQGKFWSQLNLTEQQKSQMKALMRSHRKDHQGFLSILTPEQKAQLQTLRQQHKGENSPHARGEFLGQLNLSPEQKQQLEAFKASNKQEREAFHQQMMEILTPEQRQQLQTMRQQHQGGHRFNGQGSQS